MASPSVRSKSAGEGDPGSDGSQHNVHVTLPATISAGDTLLVFICQDGLNLLEDGDSGFIYLGGGVHSTSQIAGGVFYKKADGTEDGTTVGFHGTANLDFAYVAYALSGAADPYITPPTLSEDAEGTDNTAEPPECDPGESKDYYWLAVAGCDYRTFNTYPSDMTLDQQRAGTSGMFNASAAGAGKQSTASSYAPTGNFELTASNEWLAWTVGIHPTGSIAVNLTGPITVTSSVVADLGMTYGAEPVTGITAILEFSPCPGPNYSASWTDITRYLRSWSIAWGASGIQEQVRARTATFVLDNNDRRFEPLYADGTYYPDIGVGSMIYFNLKVDTTGGSTIYPLFYGIAQAWRPTYSTPPARDGVCVLECCDPTLVLANDLTSMSLTADTSDQQIDQILDEMAWDGIIYRDLETGDTALAAYSADKEALGPLIERIVNSEGGWFYWQPGVRKTTARFLNRLYFANMPGDETVYYLDDNGVNGQYVDIILGSDDDHLYTRALVTRKDGTQQSYKNTSVIPYLGERTYQATGLLLQTDAEAYDRAAYIVETRARAIYNLYCTEITSVFYPGMPVVHSVNALGLTQPFAPISITHTPTVGTALEFDCRVVGGRISQQAPGQTVTIVGRLVDAIVIGGDFWILQDPVRGVLGTTTVLGW